VVKNRKVRSAYTSFKDYQVTPETIFWNRREFIQKLGSAALAGSALSLFNSQALAAKLSPYSTSESLSSEHVITHHNNFYEFSTSKTKPAELAANFNPSNDWKVKVSGLVEKPGEYTLDDILNSANLEERIYRLRCVEGWSMVIPWNGFQLSDLINKVKPTSRAKFIEFKTLKSRKVFPGQNRGALGFNVLPWPYREGLRMDEAMNPLAFIATGVYGKSLPGQNGAPLRLVVPWKYGFKSIKSIVSIRFLEQRPTNTWHKSAPREYGFYANVNPSVDHPRWSQAHERRITDESFFGVKRIPTQMFNGYSDLVADMYKGMDLTEEY
jgi:methionine sulfoxide reductase catalytic subunit